jgi:hypothetical protein
MKNFYIVICVLITLASCSKSDIDAPAETVVDASSMSDFSAGGVVRFFNVDLNASPVNAISNGQGQSWDFSNLAVKDTSSIIYLSPAPNDSFPSATYMVAVKDSFYLGGSSSISNSKYYGELSSAGIASLGKSVQAISFSLSPNDVTFPAQTIKHSQKIYSVNFPMHYNDSFGAAGITEDYKLILNAPPFATNTPGAERSTISYSNKVVASGAVKLKGYAEAMPVLVVRNFTSTRFNYFINGQPAPATLLAMAGVTDGEVYDNHSYSFYSPSIGFVGSIYMNSGNNTVIGATFRRNF